MDPWLRCPNGHAWEPGETVRPATSTEDFLCPHCGEPASRDTDRPGEGALDETRVIDPRLNSGSQTPPACAATPKIHPKIEGYEILDELGRGGMGVVYRARQTKLNRIVALKMVLAGEHSSERGRARFLSEAEIAAGLQHANIIQIYELGEDEGLPFISMEYVDGGGMRQWMKTRGKDYPEIALFFEKLARAADWAHQRAVVHRDLKPANVFLASDGEPKIGDFGLAKRLDDDGSGPQLTLSGEKMGTPHYMAPEQAYSDFGPVGPGTDIYALGVMLYQTLAGRVPLSASTEPEMLRRLRLDDPPPPSNFAPDTPRDLETVCLKCLRKRPQDRYLSAAALADDIRRFRNGEAVLAKPLTAATRSFRWIRRHRTGLTLGCLVASFLIAASAWAFHGFFYVWNDARIYTDFTRRHGQYFGIGKPLSEEDLTHRFQAFRLIRAGRNGRSKRLECVDSRGRTTPHPNLGELIPGIFEGLPEHMRPAAFEIVYSDDDGLPAEERLLDPSGQLVARLRYAYPDGSGTESNPQARVRADYVDGESRAIATRGGISSVLLLRDALGQEEVLAYTDQDQAIKADPNGVSIRRLEYDGNGRVSAIVNLDADGIVTGGKEGWSRLEVAYHLNDPDPRVESRFFDAEGNPAASGGVHRIRNDFDAHGNRVAVSRFGLDGTTPARFSFGDGATNETMTYDTQLRRASWTFSGLPALEGAPFREIDTYTWDEDGTHTIRSRFEDADDKPAFAPGQYLTSITRRNRFGQPVEIRRDGYPPAAYPFSRQLETLEPEPGGGIRRRIIAYQSKDVGIAYHADGNSLYTEDYDSLGRLRLVTLSGMDPTRESYDRAVTRTDWPERATEKATHWNLSAALTSHSQNADQAHLPNPDATPIRPARASAWIAARRESVAMGDTREFPLRKSSQYLDADGNPVRCSKGNEAWSRDYDGQGRPQSERHTGFDEALTGYATAVIDYHYATKDLPSASSATWTFLDGSGTPVRHPDGYLDYTEDFDDEGLTIAIIKTGYDQTKEGHFGKRLEYRTGSEGGTTAVETYTDSEGHPVRDQPGNLRYEQVMDANDRIEAVQQIGFDPDEHPFYREHIRFVYNEAGTVTQWIHTYFDAKGGRVTSDSGYTERVDEFDEFGRNTIITESGFDPEKFPYAVEIQTTRWAKGKIKHSDVWTYLDAEGQSTRHSDGYLRFEALYDDKGRASRYHESGFDQGKHGFATQIREFEYWETGTRRSIHWHYEDTDGNAIRYPDMNYPSGYFDYTDEFSPQGQPVANILSGFDPALVPFFLERKTFAPHPSIPDAEIATTTYEDAGGNRARGFAGELTSVSTRIPSVSTVLIREEVDESAYGYQSMTATFDGQGTLESVTFTDSKGQPVSGVRPYLIHVMPGGTGDRAGLRKGDYLIALNGILLESSQHFIHPRLAGKRSLRVLREGETLSFPDLPPGVLGIFCADRVPPEP